MHRRYSGGVRWNCPSPRVAELIRQGATLALSAPPEWLDELDEVTLQREELPGVNEDPALRAAVKRTNRANLAHWAQANIHDPGAPVPANLGPEPLGIARDLVRRGLDDRALHSYRIGQNVAWRYWMQLAFELTDDPQELRELLDVTALSISDFIDAMIEGISAQMRLEREQLTRGTHAERREVVALIIDGSPITRERASTRLGYDLGLTHTAAVVWTEDPEPDRTALEAAGHAFAAAAGAPRALTVVAGASTLWVWAPGTGALDLTALGDALESIAGVHVAVGPRVTGIEGFRRSHLDAIATQHLLARMESRLRLATYDAVQLVALVTQDQPRADQFVRETLCALESASDELRTTVLTFINTQCNAAQTAKRLFAHRNSIVRRLARADDLLPRPVSENAVQIAVALEVVRWRGS